MGNSPTTLKFSVPAIPISYNKCFKIIWSFRKTMLSQEAIQFKDLVKQCMPQWQDNPNGLYSINIYIYYNWLFKNGKLRKLDVQNLDKLVVDAVFEQGGVDDSHVVVEKVQKIQSRVEVRTDVEVWQVGVVGDLK